MVRAFLRKLNNDKKLRQRVILALCLVLFAAALLVFRQMRTTGIAMTDEAYCGIPEHTHDESCIAEQVLICGDAAHAHTEDCYETVWSCGLEEHTHTLECFPDLTADVESPEIWEATFPQLSGDPATDLVRIAESQLGYTESARNVNLTEGRSGETVAHGYTRYGAFAGDPYCDNWSAAFASFCLYYAGMDESEAPGDTDCEAMLQHWEEAGSFSKPDAHQAQPGDLVFLDRDGNGKADSVGIVTLADASYVKAIEGNSNEKVEENRISASDKTILGFGVTAASETDENDPADASDRPAYHESADTNGYAWIKDNAGAAKAAPAAAKKAAPKKNGPQRAPVTGDVPLDDYITGVSGSGTTKVDDNLYQTSLELRFKIDSALVEEVTNGGYKFVYDLPEDVLIPEELTHGGPYYAYLLDSYPELEVAFTYNFIPTGDGNCKIEVVYDNDFLESVLESGTENINNVLRFRCFIRENGDAGQDGLDVTFTDDQSLFIPPEEINENYDITAQKTGSYTADGKLHYEVTVSSVNGTPSDVNVMDTFTYSGDGTITPPSSISVVKHNADGTIETSEIPAQGHLTAISQNIYEVDLNLPQLDDDEYYTIVYDYGLTGLSDEDAGVSAYNTLEATSSDGHDTTSDYADYFIYKQQRKKVGKEGIPYGEYIQWVVSVNDRGGDIAGKVIYDESFADAQNETINGTNGIVVQRGWAEATPGVDYEYVYENGAIVGVRFLPADGSAPNNNNNYHITYYTHPDVVYGETAIVHNEAEFDGDTASYDVVVTGGDFDKTANGNESLGNDLYGMNWTVTVEVPMGGILSGTSFSDTLSPEGHSMTQAQYNALVAALQAAWSPNAVTVTPVTTGGAITGYTFTVGTEGNGYLLDDGLLDKITWQYQTTGNMDGKASQAFVNTFTDGQKTLPVTSTVSPNVKKLNARKVSDWQTIFTEDPTSISLDYEDEDKTFTWIVQVTPTPGLLEYRVIDSLPQGVELLGVKVIPSPLTAWNYSMENTNNNLTIAADGTISGEIGNLWLSRTVASGAVSTAADGRQTVDLTLTANSANADLFNGTFNVIYYCRLSEDAWPENGTVHLALNNTVRVESGDDDYGEAENQINVDATKTEDIVNKMGHWDKNSHLITYTVDINPLAENLLTSTSGTLDPEWLSFTDVLSYTAKMGTGTGEAILSLNSVVLEKEENGVWSPLTNVQWSARTETDATNSSQKNAIIEMRVPDETHLRLTYTYHINCSMDNGITLSNSATLEGHGDESANENTHIEAEDFQTSGESTFEEFCLIKIDQENGTPLADAVFTVYAWDAVNEEWSATAKSYTTDTAGKIIIKVIDEYPDGTKVYNKDTAYCIMETTAPPGYMLPEHPRLFYFWFSEHAAAPSVGPDDFLLTAADISTSSHRVEAENLLLPEYNPGTGIVGLYLLPSLAAVFAIGAGICGLTLKMIKKRKLYDTDA